MKFPYGLSSCEGAGGGCTGELFITGATGDVPYKLVDGTVIANGWSNIINDTLTAPINESEYGVSPRMRSDWNGTSIWMFNSSDICAVAGSFKVARILPDTIIDYSHPQRISPGACSNRAFLLCFEQ